MKVRSGPSISRRELLIAGAATPLLSACATDLNVYSSESFAALAQRLGVCAASHVSMKAGRPGTPVLVRGCASASLLPIDPVFQAASLTKPVIAFAALKLVRDGRLDLRAPVSRYLPEGYAHRQKPFNGPKDNPVDQVAASTLARVPVGSLLNHSSGLPNWTRGALSPEFEPGTRWQYSGEGYVLLQAVLSAVAGQDIESFVSTTVLEPLGMRSTRLRLTDDIRERVVDGTSSFGGRVRFDITEPNAAASLYTTAEDYAKLMAAWLADPVLMALTLADPMSVDPALGLAWGHGWGIETASGGPYIWQWGNNPGFRAFAMVSVVAGNGFVLLSNSERGMPLAAPLARATVPAEHGVFRFHMLG
jgi:CubicO group peptidase (beta-lactamase class C family)